ncbi:ArsR/SmtB family transcription factor [Mesorhizobium metallidurans]|nr:metalloregulator ArsR/SmtB family transcription factor [Mesorhizobium metallidurans]
MTERKSEHIDLIDLLGALANANRLKILSLIIDGELCVSAINAHVDLSEAALSHRLAKLRKLRLIESRRQGTTIYYPCRSQKVRSVFRTLDEICSGLIFGAAISPGT